jgi:hypothetical protein
MNSFTLMVLLEYNWNQWKHRPVQRGDEIGCDSYPQGRIN